MLDCTSCAITEFPLFDRLSPPVARCLLARGVERHYARGEVICLQSEPARTLKLVSDGWVKLYRVTPSGDEAVLATLGRGSSFDEVAALRGGGSKMSVEAMSDCTLLHFDLNAICSCDGADAEISAAVLGAASDKMDELIDQLEAMKVKTGVQRLCEFLLDHARPGARTAAMELPFDKVVLAGKLGMQPESLSRAFKKLKHLGVVSNRRQVRIEDVPTLRRFVDAELEGV
ncbi:Crp/Fnr family transcriptional regulator [Aliiroseovarius sp.]|uniref:Crp/Fnr family transcriptional regulator n=1 Tax=Aliiroseovarius sp. TaxID=1872442 RepID=UPI003BAAB9D4